MLRSDPVHKRDPPFGRPREYRDIARGQNTPQVHVLRHTADEDDIAILNFIERKQSRALHLNGAVEAGEHQTDLVHADHLPDPGIEIGHWLIRVLTRPQPAWIPILALLSSYARRIVSSILGTEGQPLTLEIRPP